MRQSPECPCKAHHAYRSPRRSRRERRRSHHRQAEGIRHCRFGAQRTDVSNGRGIGVILRDNVGVVMRRPCAQPLVSVVRRERREVPQGDDW